MRFLPGTLSLLFLHAAVLAQAPASPGKTNFLVVTGQNCPVGLSASHYPQGLTMRDATDAHAGQQGLRVTFAPVGPKGIVAAKITLHGLSGSNLVPAGQTAGPDATEDLSITPSLGEQHRFQSIVYAQKLTALQWVEVTSLTFADGSHWQASANSTCRVAPSLYRLVNLTGPK